MSKYFQPIDFKVTPNPELPKQTKVVWDSEKLKAAHEQILADIEKIKTGTSQYSAYAVDPGRFGFPAVNALAKFIQSPDDRLLKTFEDTAKSTFGARAGNDFADRLRTAMTVEEV